MKTIKIDNKNNLPTIDYRVIEPLQGDLKTLPEENLEKLKKSILEFGFKIPKFVWIDRGHYYIIDGHQTKKALESLEKEGYTIPKIPYVEIEAKNRREAAKILLEINSRYGVINPETSFFEDFDIDLDFIKDIKIPEFDLKMGLYDNYTKPGKRAISRDITFKKDEEEAMSVSHPGLFENKKTILISFSGGRDSSFAAYWAKKNFPKKRIVLCFSDTGVEFPAMSSHTSDCAKFLDVEYKLLKPNKDMWLEIEKYGFPTPLSPWCMNNLIYTPLNKFFKTFDVEDTIILDGSHGEQVTRLSNKTKTSSPTPLKKYDFFHPAFDISHDVIESILNKSGMPIWEGYSMGFVRTACWMCPNQCGDQALALSENYPGFVNVIRRWEEKIGTPLQSYNGRSIDVMIAAGQKNRDRKRGKN